MTHKMASLCCLEHIPKRRFETQDTGLRFTLYTSVPIMFNQDSIQYEVESYESSSIICCRRTTCLDYLQQFTHIVIQNSVLHYFTLQIALFIEWILNMGMGMCKCWRQPNIIVVVRPRILVVVTHSSVLLQFVIDQYPTTVVMSPR